MRRHASIRVLSVLLALGPPAAGEIIDRIAVSVGSSVIAGSAIDREIRVTALLDGIRPDLRQSNRRATADRMVEQKLVQREMELSRYPLPDASAAEPSFAEFRKLRYPTDEGFQLALADFGVSEKDVKEELLWQMTLLRFIEVRFRPGVQVSDADIETYFEKTVKPAAEASHPGLPVSLEDYRDRIRDTLSGQRADKELDNWLKETRQHTEIVFHKEDFQ